MRYPAIKPIRYSGNEPIVNNDGEKISVLEDFWRWAYSDLIGNTERGVLAEYLVACALGIEKESRISWRKYDLLTKEGIRVEVKSSGYLQTWEQKKLSNISFGIRETLGWNENDNSYDSERHRQSDVYVFCVHKHTKQESVNPLDISQWEFYLISTQMLNKKAKNQKSISLSALIKIGAEKCSFDDLKANIGKISCYEE